MTTTFLRHTSGREPYAKPLPLVTSPAWDADIIEFIENGETGSYSAEVDPLQSYEVFDRADGDPAVAGDEPIAAVRPSPSVDLSAEQIEELADGISERLGNATGPAVRTLQFVTNPPDISGVSIRVANRTLTTDTTGATLPLNLNPGDYPYQVITPPGYEPASDGEVTIGENNVVQPIELTPLSSPIPSVPGAANYVAYFRNQGGIEPLAGITLEAKLLGSGSVVTGNLWNLNTVYQSTSDGNGAAGLALLPNQDYELSAKRPNGTTHKLKVRTGDPGDYTLADFFQG